MTTEAIIGSHPEIKIVPFTSKRIKNMTDVRQGKILVIGYLGHNSIRKDNLWLVRCDCGKEKIVLHSSLYYKQMQSCGCSEMYPLKPIGAATRSKEYNTWNLMIQRCYNPKDSRYADYAGRGVIVCDRWKNSFEAFLEDMGPKPGKRYSLGRINNDGIYEPSNCRWENDVQQARNTRKSIFLTAFGETKHAKEWGEIKGIRYQTIITRIEKYGWSVEDALTIPIGNLPEGVRRGIRKDYSQKRATPEEPKLAVDAL